MEGGRERGRRRCTKHVSIATNDSAILWGSTCIPTVLYYSDGTYMYMYGVIVKAGCHPVAIVQVVEY